MKELGYGKGYANPHQYEGEFVVADYLPEQLIGTRFYKPSDEGYEKILQERRRIWNERKATGRNQRKS